MIFNERPSGEMPPGSVPLYQREPLTDVPAAPPAPAERKRPGAGTVVAVQCAACAVVLLLVLLLRAVGGSAYEELKESFRDALARNDLMATLAALWDGDPLAEESSDPLAGRPVEENGDESLPEETPTEPTTVPTTAPTTAPTAARAVE